MNTLFFFDFGESITEGFFGIFLYIDGMIYSLISSAFKIFMALASCRLFTNDMYKTISNSIYFFMGVAMLFVLSYAILKGVIDPDKVTKGEVAGPKTAKTILIAVLGLALVPVIFNILYQAQGIIIDNELIDKIIFRSTAFDQKSLTYTAKDGSETTSVDVVTDEYISQIGGNYTAVVLWQSFFRPADDLIQDNTDNGLFTAADGIEGETSRYFFAKAKTEGIIAGIGLGIAAIGLVCVEVFSMGTLTPVVIGGATALVAGGMAVYDTAEGMSKIGEKMTLAEAYAWAGATGDFACFEIFVPNIVEEGQIKYSIPIMAICGVFVLYSFISFSIDMGVRAAKLAYYQIIAPVPLVMQIIPKYKSNFQKYIESVIHTFMEVIIRIFVIYVVVYLIMHITDLFGSVDFKSKGLSGVENAIATAFLIIGLILFAKQAPKIIGESLGVKTGDLQFGIGKKLADGEVFTAGAAAASMVTSGVRNFRNKFDGTEGRFMKKATRASLSAVGGAAGAARRSVMDRYRSGKPLPNMKAAQDAYRKTTNDTTDARDKREEWYQTHSTNADGSKRSGMGTFVKGHAEDIGKTVSAWSIGTIKTDKEDRDMKFTKSLDSLKGNLREEAYKKDNRTKALKQQYEALRGQEVSEYKDGCSQQAMSDEISRRLTADARYNNLQQQQQANRTKLDLAQDTLTQANTAYEQARANGVTGAQLTALDNAKKKAQQDFDKAQKDVLASDKALGSRRDAITQDVASIAKRSQAEMSMALSAHQAEVDAYRQAMEASADSFIQKKITDSSSNTFKDVQAFLQDNASYISNYGSSVLDSESGLTVSQLIASTFGATAASKATLNTLEVDQPDIIDLGGGMKNDGTFDKPKDGKPIKFKRYKLENGRYVEYDVTVTPDSSGKMVATEKAAKKNGQGVSYTDEEFYNIVAIEAAKKGQEVKSRTNTSQGTGRSGDTYKIINRKYNEKVIKKREQESKK